MNNVLCKSFVQARVITDGPNLFCLFSVFEEPEDPSNRSFFSEIISSISDVKFSHSGRSDSVVMTGSYNNFFRMFDRNTKRDITLEASRENNKPRTVLKPRKVCASGKRKKDEISVDSLDFNKKILHTAWHPKENIIAVATTNNLYIFQDKVN